MKKFNTLPILILCLTSLMGCSGSNSEFSDRDFDGLDIGSMICVPISNKYDRLGCIQFVNRKDSNKFTQEDADLCEMLTSLIAINID